MLKNDKGKDESIREVTELMDEVISDSSVPRNIRAAVEEAKNKLNSKDEVGVTASSAIYFLQDITNDINMPAHTRTEIWTIISALEGIRERHK